MTQENKGFQKLDPQRDPTRETPTQRLVTAVDTVLESGRGSILKAIFSDPATPLSFTHAADILRREADKLKTQNQRNLADAKENAARVLIGLGICRSSHPPQP